MSIRDMSPIHLLFSLVKGYNTAAGGSLERAPSVGTTFLPQVSTRTGKVVLALLQVENSAKKAFLTQLQVLETLIHHCCDRVE